MPTAGRNEHAEAADYIEVFDSNGENPGPPRMIPFGNVLPDALVVAGAAAPSAYTQTYSTANRTVAAPTAAAVVTLTDSTGLSGTHDDTLAATTVPGALTVTDGTGTNDGTIGAITDNASTITAVQELAAKINAIITLLGVMVQNQSDVAQKVIELVAEHTKIVADDLDNRQTVTALIDDLQAVAIVA